MIIYYTISLNPTTQKCAHFNIKAQTHSCVIRCPYSMFTFNLMNARKSYFSRSYNLKIYNNKMALYNIDYLLLKCFVPK